MEDEDLEDVREYNCFDQMIKLKKKGPENKIKRCVTIGWKCLKRPMCNVCIMPNLAYGCETWTFMKSLENKFNKKSNIQNISKRLKNVNMTLNSD